MRERDDESMRRYCAVFNCVLTIAFVIAFPFLIWVLIIPHNKIPPPVITLDSMDFTVLNITETRLSAKWDLSIGIPCYLPGHYICLQGDLQAYLLYKNVTLATLSPQKYSNLQYRTAYLHKGSVFVSNEDISGSIGKDIIEDIKNKKEVQFASLFSLTDCTKKTTGVMSFACHEVTLKFEPGSKMKATVFRNHPECKHL